MPAPPAFGAADYQQAMLNLLPRGRVWRRDPDSILARVLGALAPTYERSTVAAAALLVDAFPTTTFFLLPEWEASLGLPDSCAPVGQTIAERQLAVAAKWAARGGQTSAYFVKLAAALGYTITVQEFAPARYGLASYGDRYLEEPWAHAWQVTVLAGTLYSAKYGSACYGDRYQTYGDAVLECELSRFAPAQTVLRFAYADVAIAAAWDGSPGWEVGGWAA